MARIQATRPPFSKAQTAALPFKVSASVKLVHSAARSLLVRSQRDLCTSTLARGYLKVWMAELTGPQYLQGLGRSFLIRLVHPRSICCHRIFQIRPVFSRALTTD